MKSYVDQKVTAVQNLLEKTMDERDRRYDVMFIARDTAITAALAAQEKAVAAALAAQEKAVAAAADASEKAINKAENAQIGVNQRGNEFRASLDDYTKLMSPRTEVETRFVALADKVDSQRAEFVGIINGMREQILTLQRGESHGEGGKSAQSTSKMQSNWIIQIVISVGMALLGMVVTLVYFLSSK